MVERDEIIGRHDEPVIADEGRIFESGNEIYTEIPEAALVREAIGAAKTSYEAFVNVKFWRQTFLKALGSTQEAIQSALRKRIDAYIKGELTEDQRSATIAGLLGKFKDGIFQDLETAYVQAGMANVDRERDARKVEMPSAEIETLPTAEAVEHVEVMPTLVHKLLGIERYEQILESMAADGVDQHPSLPLDLVVLGEKIGVVEQEVKQANAEDQEAINVRIADVKRGLKGLEGHVKGTLPILGNEQLVGESIPESLPRVRPTRRRRSIFDKPKNVKAPKTEQASDLDAEGYSEIAASYMEPLLDELPPKETEVKKLPQTRRRVKESSVIPDHLLSDVDAVPEIDFEPIIAPHFFEPPKETIGEKMRNGLMYILNRGKEKVDAAGLGGMVEESVAYHLRGEKTPEELGERERSWYGVGASSAASIIRTGMVIAPIPFAIVADLPRHLKQKEYTKIERDALTESIKSTALELRKVDESGQGYDAFLERHNQMTDRVMKSRYISKEDKEKFLDEISAVIIDSEEQRKLTDDQVIGRIAKIVEVTVVERVTQTDVIKQASNTVFALAGLHFLRAPVYGAIDLTERYLKELHRTPEAGNYERVRKIIVDEFTEVAKVWTGDTTQEKAYAGVKTLGKVARAAGLAYASRELWDFMPSMEAMTGYDLHKLIDDALKFSSARDSVHVLGEIAKHPEPTIEAPDISKTIGHVQGIEQVEISALAFELPDHFENGLVQHLDGISQAMSRVIESNPEKFGYSGRIDDDLMLTRFVGRFTNHLLKEQGLLHTWLSKKAEGNIIITPVQEHGVWRIAFLDASSHEEITGEALKPFLEPEPRH